MTLWGDEDYLADEDVLVCGDSDEAKQVVIDLARCGDRPRRHRRWPAATGNPQLEPLTAVLISINKKYKTLGSADLRHLRQARPMGLFSRLKAQVEAAQAAGNAMAGVRQASDIPEFVAPWPQEEVDRLLQGPGPIRAIMLGSRHQVLEDGERIGRMRVHVRLRPRGPEGTLGDEVTVKASGAGRWPAVATCSSPASTSRSSAT